jgi:hypothetical protein
MSEEPPAETGPDDLDRIEGRIAELKEPAKQERTLALGVSLVFSMGTVVASCLLVGYWGGNWVKQQTGSELLGLVPLLLSLVMAGVGAWKLMRPLL